jgi:hypothetical protein
MRRQPSKPMRSCPPRRVSAFAALAIAVLLSAEGACASRSVAAPSAVATGSAHALAVELAAARHLLTDYADLQVVIHPMFADSFSSPGYPGPARRDEARTAALARALAGTVYAEPNSSRGVVKGTARLILSEPVVRTDTAWVTGTILWYRDDQPRWGRGYRTDRFTLTREVTGWRVLRTDVLGIT